MLTTLPPSCAVVMKSGNLNFPELCGPLQVCNGDSFIILRCVIPVVSNKSHHKVYVYIVKHNYVLGGMLFTICKAQLHVSAINIQGVTGGTDQTSGGCSLC
jgi:hypothetical protein